MIKSIKEWFDALIFAVIVASLIRWSTFEAFTIPTPSMEKSLLVGDLQEDTLEIIGTEFSQDYRRIYDGLFGNVGGMSILNYLKKHPKP